MYYIYMLCMYIRIKIDMCIYILGMYIRIKIHMYIYIYILGMYMRIKIHVPACRQLEIEINSLDILQHYVIL